MALHAIHKAVLQDDRHLRQVRRLLRQKRRNLDAPDSRGATPLMLASLRGFPKMVTFLLEKGASWAARDKSDCTALDYIRGPYAEERRAMYRKFMKRSSANRSPSQRRQLQQLLTDVPVLKTQFRTAATGTLSFSHDGPSLRIHKLIAKVNVAITQNTTAACIAAGNSLKPEMCAVSGWTATTTPGMLDGHKYTQLVREMADILDFELPKHCYDTPGGGSLPQNVGRYNATHCEKQLAAYWVESQLRFAFGSTDMSRLRDLKDCDLPAHRQKACIYLSHRPCVPCRLFLGLVQHATGIKICVFPQALLREVSREKAAASPGCKNCTCQECVSRRLKSRRTSSRKDAGKVKNN